MPNCIRYRSACINRGRNRLDGRVDAASVDVGFRFRFFLRGTAVFALYVGQRTDVSRLKRQDTNSPDLIERRAAMNSIASWIAYIVILVAGWGALGIGWI
jgi:hypothetical protein